MRNYQRNKNLKEREPKNQGNQYDVVNSNYKEELLHLKKVNQDMLIQVRKLKQENKSLQENLDCKRLSVDKETMTNAIHKSSKDQIQTLEREAMPISSKFKRTILLSHRYKHQQKMVLKTNYKNSQKHQKLKFW